MTPGIGGCPSVLVQLVPGSAGERMPQVLVGQGTEDAHDVGFVGQLGGPLVGTPTRAF
jgi:hypothetical protein